MLYRTNAHKYKDENTQENYVFKNKIQNRNNTRSKKNWLKNWNIDRKPHIDYKTNNKIAEN